MQEENVLKISKRERERRRERLHGSFSLSLFANLILILEHVYCFYYAKILEIIS